MKYVRRTTKNIQEDFLNQLLLDRGIIEDDKDFKEKFFNPTTKNLIEDTLLDNMEEGYQLLTRHLENGASLYLVVD